MKDRQALFETIANYTYDWESWIDGDGRLVWVNPAVQRMTGYGIGECLGMADYPLPMIDPRDRPRIAEQMRLASAGSAGNDLEFRIRHRFGHIVWGAVSWQTLRDAQGRPLGFRTSVRDITDRKRAEVELRRAYDEVSLANRAKSRFLAAASHDLRQPLQAAMLFLATLRRRLAGPAERDIAASISLCLESGSSLLDSLLDVSRLDAGVIEVNALDFKLQDVFDRALVAFGPAAAEAGVELHLRATALTVRSDPVLLERIVDNYLANAIRYAQGGRVLLCARVRGRGVRIEVRDNGPGIAPDQHALVFDEFYQVGNPERDRRKGLGLGLAIVARIARLLEARIGLRSAPARGSVFSVDVPLAPGGAPAPAPVREENVDGILSGRFIAAIDDEPLQLAALDAFLRSLDCGVLAADSGSALIAALQDAPRSLDLIIADYRLRGSSTGAEAVSAVRHHLGREVPAVLLTGDTEPDRIAEATASGLRVLHKPIVAAELIAALAEALQ